MFLSCIGGLCLTIGFGSKSFIKDWKLYSSKVVIMKLSYPNGKPENKTFPQRDVGNPIINTLSKTVSAILSARKEPQVSASNHSFIPITESHCCKQNPIGSMHAEKMADIVFLLVFLIGFPAFKKDWPKMVQNISFLFFGVISEQPSNILSFSNFLKNGWLNMV